MPQPRNPGGRPRGRTLNTAAVEDVLRLRCMSAATLAADAGVHPSHLADMLRRSKGASEATIQALATVLGVEPATIAPELSGRYVQRRPGDIVHITTSAAVDAPAEATAS